MPLQLLTISCLEIYFLYLSGVYCGFYVNYGHSNVCGIKGASAVLPCRFEYYGMGFYLGGEWYEEHRKRVTRKYTFYNPDCSLYIDKLSHDQSGIYHFRFRTSLHKSWIRGTPGVTLSVTDLLVREEAVVGGNQTKLTCSTSCSLGSQYVWYRNGQQLRDKTTASILLDSTKPSEEGSYSCTVRGYEAQCSPAVCAPEKQCWGVTYSSTSICALLGSSVDIPCTYRYLEDHRVKTTFWFKKQKSRNDLEDLRLDENYENHVEYIGHKENNNCTLRLKDIRESHSGEYGFRFTTEQGESYSGLPGVTITVTTLQVILPPKALSEGESVTLTCNTTCTLSNIPIFIWHTNGTSKHTTRDNMLHLNPISSEDAGSYSCMVLGHESLSSMSVNLDVRFLQVYITSETVKEGDRVTLTCNSTRGLSNNSTFVWYKNGQPVTCKHTTRNKLHLNPVSSEDAGSYSCAVRRHESLSSTAVFLSVRYKPKNISVSFSPGEGSFVTLTCSSDANPPVYNYTWYMKSGAESLVRGTGESIGFNVTSDTSGIYYCEVQNEVGSQNSGNISVPKEVLFHTTTSRGCASGLIVTIILVSILLFGMISICMYKIACTRRNTQTKKESNSDVRDDTYTALNRRNKSPDYDTLQNLRSLSDTYMPLQRRDSAEKSNLFNRNGAQGS